MAALVCTLAAGPAAAASTAYDQCLDKSGGVTSSMRDCSEAEGKRQNRELNAVYKRVMSRLDPAARLKLRNEERAWLKRMHNQCAALARGEGTSALLAADDCWISSNDKRIKALKRMEK